MPTELEELQVKEFLKRAEIKTMKKDLRALREVDALKERDKIATIRTLEEQRLEHEKKLKEKEEAQIALEKIKREKVLSENAQQERLAEKDLKEYATEQERQQIFLYESQRLAFEKQADEIDNKKDPELRLQKNQLLLEKQNIQAKLKAIEDEEKKMEEEQGFIIQKSQTSNIPSEKKSLEERRGEIERKLQEKEKERWSIESQIQQIDSKITEVDNLSQGLVAQKNELNQKILGVNKSLRDIYSGVVERVQEERAKRLQEQRTARGATAQIKLEEKEEVQRREWGKISAPKKQLSEKFSAPVAVPGSAPAAPIKKKVIKISDEEARRKEFLENVEKWTKEKEQLEAAKNSPQAQNDNSIVAPKKNTN